MKKVKFKLNQALADYLARIAKNVIETDRVTSIVLNTLSHSKDHLSLMVVLLVEGVFRSIYSKLITRGTFKTLVLTKAELVAMHWFFLNHIPGDNIFGNQELLTMFDQALISL